MTRIKYETLYKIVSEDFRCGFGVSIDGHVNWASPMFGYVVGWHRDEVLAHCRESRWYVGRVGDDLEVI